MSIEKMMCLSTGHIEQATTSGLDNAVRYKGVNIGEKPQPWFSQLIVYPHAEYGWLICIAGQVRPEGETNGYDYRDGVPEDLLRCIAYATANGCDWLLLDRDAELIDELPSFDW